MRLTMYPRKRPTGPQRPTVAVRIGRKLAEQARFIFGDRLIVEYDSDSGKGLIKRLPPSASEDGLRGWIYRPTNKMTEAKRGKSGAGVVQFTPNEGAASALFPNAARSYTTETAAVTPEGILFDLPKASQSAVEKALVR